MMHNPSNKDFIESIRAEYMGLKDLPRRSLASSIQTLADDLYAKDSHFIFELIQNAEDNAYPPGVRPTLRFILREMEYQRQTRLCLRVENNETGFTKEHVKALCQVGQSTKKKSEGYIGEKGIGFKSVFRVTDCPQVHSNGFHFCLPEKEAESGLGYIVPTWIDTPPTSLHDCETSIILPLKNDAHADRVAEALQDVAPETILFLARLKVIEIIVEIRDMSYEIVIEKSDNGTPVVELTHLKRTKEDVSIQSSRYWLTSKEFKKPTKVVPEKRKDIHTREVFVAIPLGGDQLQTGKLFAYLPVWESTGLPFLVNADFLLVSSREGIHEDEPWNEWLRECIAPVYVNAFLACVAEHALPIEERASVYASIPTQCHQAFLDPVVTEIQKCLRETSCILTSFDAKLVMPESSRLVAEEWRALLEEHDSVPSALGSEFFFIHKAISPSAEGALKAIGVQPLLQCDVAACLTDTAWLEQQSYDWLISLYRRMMAFDSSVLDELPIVPAILFPGRQTEYQCGNDQPIYFRPSWEESRALRGIPDWLRKARPISFLSKEFQQELNTQGDSTDLRKWMTDALSVYPFSSANYCVDVLDYLEKQKGAISKTRLVQITRFLNAHAGRQFDWSCLPVLLSDDRIMTIAETRQLTWNEGAYGSPVSVQALAVPENYNPDSGWQCIWKSENDRRHFVALSTAYSKCSKDFFYRIGAVSYPGMAAVVRKEEQLCSDDSEKTALRTCHSSAASSRYWETRVHSCLLPQFPDPMTKECARAILGWLRSLNVHENASDEQWWKFGLKIKGTYQNYGRGTKYFASPLLAYLQKAQWLSTTAGLVRPSLAFLPTPEAKEILGDTVPYIEDELPRPLLSLLGINTSVTVETLLNRLEACAADSNMNVKLPERIYKQLSSRLSYVDGGTAIQRFRDKPLIFVAPDTESPRWVKTHDCVWNDASAIFGDDFLYLEGVYPKLKEFFVQTLGVKPEVDAECYARHWLKLQMGASRQGKELRPIVEKLYREIRKALDINPRPQWLTDFLEEAQVFTQDEKFEERDSVIIPDDGDLKRLFDGDVKYAWRPSGDSFADWSDFFVTFGLERLSECVKVDLASDIPTEPFTEGRLLTMEAVQMIASWLREKEPEVYTRLVTDRVFKCLFEVQEERSEQPVRVSYLLNIGDEEFEKLETAVVFWDHQNSRFVLGPSFENVEIKQAAAKQLTRFILKGKRDQYGLANWVELSLGAMDTKRLKSNNWSVPRGILEMCSSETTTPDLPGIDEDVSASLTRETQESESPGTGVVTPKSHRDDSGAMLHGKESAFTSKDGLKSAAPTSPQKTDQAKTPSVAATPVPDGDGGTGGAPRTYADMLNDSLNQPGEIEIGEDWRIGGAPVGESVPNPNRRSIKLTEGHQERIHNEPEADDRRRITERTILEPPDPQVRQALLEWYGGKCQICGNTWPERNGRPFFITARLVERQHARWLDDPANAVCLCAEHFAQWRHASKEICEEIPYQLTKVVGHSPGGKCDQAIHFKLLGEEVRVRYCERHLLALKALIDASEASF